MDLITIQKLGEELGHEGPELRNFVDRQVQLYEKQQNRKRERQKEERERERQKEERERERQKEEIEERLKNRDLDVRERELEQKIKAEKEQREHELRKKTVRVTDEWEKKKRVGIKSLGREV